MIEYDWRRFGRVDAGEKARNAEEPSQGLY